MQCSFKAPKSKDSNVLLSWVWIVCEYQLTCLSTEGQHYETDGAVLDLHFRPNDQGFGDVLCAATSTGILEVYRIDRAVPQAHFLHRFRVATDDTVIFSLAWRPGSSNTIALTLSNLWTAVYVLPIDEHSPSHQTSKEPTRPSQTWLLGRQSDGNILLAPDEVPLEQLHMEYPWMSAWDAAGVTLYVGDDDALFCANGIPQLHPLSKSRPDYYESGDYTVLSTSWERRKGHEAGVTAILPCGDFVITSSYDYHLRVLSTTNSRKILADEKFDETIWRLKLMHEPAGDLRASNNDDGQQARLLVLASCMRDGTKVIEITRNGVKWDIQVLAQFTDYAEHIHYASDVKNRTAEEQEYRIISISFYGKKMCLWKYSDAA